MIPRVGSINYATRQGLGYLAKDFYDHGITSEVLIYAHPDGRETVREWYPESTRIVVGRDFSTRCRTDVAQFLSKIDVCLFFETPFDWNVLPLCKKHGVKTVLVPMYEWSLLSPPYQFDKVISPSLLDQKYFPGSPFLPVPVTDRYWRQRTTALRFLHNGGGIGAREHKGTRQLIEAIPYIQSPVSLTVRAQNGAALERILKDNPRSHADRRVTWEFGERSYETLWDDHDVLIAPEKFNGLSLPLQEAFAAGMLVMTTDRFPTNTWLPKGPLIPVASTQTVQVMGGHNRIEESVVDPVEIARCIDAWHGADIVEFSKVGKEFATRYNWRNLKPMWSREIASVLEIQP